MLVDKWMKGTFVLNLLSDSKRLKVPTALVSKGLKELVKSVSKDYDGLRLNQYRTSIKKLGEHLIKVNPKLASTFKEIDAELKDR